MIDTIQHIYEPIYAIDFKIITNKLTVDYFYETLHVLKFYDQWDFFDDQNEKIREIAEND